MQVKKGDFVYDPFVGTGSILVAASHYGAQTFGADIDIRIVRDGKPPRLLP
jgi:tRNA (guanine10-N2)-methyltransferase